MTGASTGIGAAIAQAFAEIGDRVAVHYSSNAEGAQRVVAGLPGTGHVIVRGDMGDAEQARAVVTDAIELIGSLDVVVNNAGIAPTPETVHDVATADYTDWIDSWRSFVDVNLLGTANVTWAAARQMIDQQAGGRIVNVGSRGAFVGEPAHPAYGASKAAVHAFGQSMAIALAPYGIAVTSVAPGFVATERQETTLAGSRGEGLRAQSPFGRVGTAREIASAVVYLASADAEWCSGAVVDLNGASYLRT
ncbi:SDR family NAD(P)-dependent oxidoreductase [Mycolicibacterium sediminis]|uniref:SDR family NAD(P)-dependent oxidoreductase n=1 Tax=Mycolicibacterium sediminis TaxID=1286180 RepID=UPI0013D7C7F3|nr:SDR family oxidoreductase [Mycolicibacterium sediminis]